MKVLELDCKFGPPRLRAIVQDIQNAINNRTPVQGCGIEIDANDNGMQISTSDTSTSTPEDKQGGGPSGGATGTFGALYGSLNGAVAQYHFIQSSPPTAVTP